MFDYGFEIPRKVEEGLLQIIRSHNPKLAALTNEDLVRRISRPEILGAWGEAINRPTLTKIGNLINKELLKEYDSSVMRKGFMVPLEERNGKLNVAIADPNNNIGIDYAR